MPPPSPLPAWPASPTFGDDGGALRAPLRTSTESRLRASTGSQGLQGHLSVNERELYEARIRELEAQVLNPTLLPGCHV